MLKTVFFQRFLLFMTCRTTSTSVLRCIIMYFFYSRNNRTVTTLLGARTRLSLVEMLLFLVVLLAIEAVIEYIWEGSDKKFMVITDSLTSLQAQKLINTMVSNFSHMCHYLSGHKDIVFAGYPAILEYRAMNGLMFWPRLPWIRQNSFFVYHILISNATSMSPANCSRYNQSLSDLQHQWNPEEMILDIGYCNTRNSH